MERLTPRVYTILSVLNDLKDGFLTLLQKPNKHPALLLIYSFIDICASLARGSEEKRNSVIFTSYLEEFLTPGMRRALPPSQLWAARSALIHSFSPLGHNTGLGKEMPIFYFSWPENRDAVQERLEAQGYAGFTLISVNEVKGIAIWAFNGMMMRVESDREFRERVIENAKHLLVDSTGMQVESFLAFVERSKSS